MIFLEEIKVNNDKVLKQLLNSGKTLIMPDAFDPISAKIIEYAGFSAIQCSGYSFSISKGYKSEENLDLKANLKITREIVDAVNIPVMADGEDGYGEGSDLKNTIKDVDRITESLGDIGEAADQINQAMDASTKDVEKLNNMTQVIHADAIKSKESAKQISKIDEELSVIVRDMISSLNGGKNAITNEELLTNLLKAKEAHSSWMKNLKRMVDEMKVYPIQVNSQKCAFGHFYHSINVSHSDIAKEWTAIDKVHNELHSMGTKVVEVINRVDSTQANNLYLDTEKLSNKIFSLIDNVIEAIEKNSKSGIEVLRVVEE